MLELATQREGVYLIPTITGPDGGIYWCYIEFSRGIGFIGGGVEAGETKLEALTREVREELLEANFDFTGLYEIPEKYEFYNPPVN